jgi:hypothetical protein
MFPSISNVGWSVEVWRWRRRLSAKSGNDSNALVVVVSDMLVHQFFIRIG